MDCPWTFSSTKIGGYATKIGGYMHHIHHWLNFQYWTHTFNVQLTPSMFNSHIQCSTHTFNVQLTPSMINSHPQYWTHTFNVEYNILKVWARVSHISTFSFFFIQTLSTTTDHRYTKWADFFLEFLEFIFIADEHL